MCTEMMFGGMTAYQIVWYFLMYSFIGWMVEVAYHAVTQGRVVNRGFLAGPVCPVYGFGMLIVFVVIDVVSGTEVSRIGEANAGIVFVCGLVLASLVEFIGGWGLYHAFHARWWDYRKKPFNIGGYVCLEFSIYWGIGALLVVRILHPLVDRFSASLIPEKWGWPVLAVIFAAYYADAVVTVLIVMGLNKKLAELDQLRASMRIVSDDLSERIGTQTLDSMQKIGEGRVQAALARAELRDAMEEKRAEVEREIAVRKAEKEIQNSRRQQEAELCSEQIREKAEAAIKELKLAAKASSEARAEANVRRREEAEERVRQLRAALAKGRMFGPRRILKAFPQLTYEFEVYNSIMKEVREEIYGK